MQTSPSERRPVSGAIDHGSLRISTIVSACTASIIGSELWTRGQLCARLSALEVIANMGRMMLKEEPEAECGKPKTADAAAMVTPVKRRKMAS